MTEAQARAALRAFVAVGELEQWLAQQPWESAPGGGWAVPADLHGFSFRLLPVAGGVRVTMSGAGAEPASWLVPAVRPRLV